MRDLDLAILLDAPTEATKRIQIARLGPVKDRRYGKFEITKDNVKNWKKNLAHLPGQRALMDFEHNSEKSPRNSEAAGWITQIDLDGDRVMADVEWSDKGAEAVRNKRYLFLSPAYGTYEDERGNEYADTLCSVALTNKPKLGSLPMLTLASEERLDLAASLAEDPPRLGVPDVPEGVHPQSHDLHRRITRYMLEHRVPADRYVRVLEEFQAGRVTL